jgi:hypothetical protein
VRELVVNETIMTVEVVAVVVVVVMMMRRRTSISRSETGLETTSSSCPVRPAALQ